MFGYVVVNQPELKFREYDVYRSCYCGLCRALKRRHGRMGQVTLSYDMTFLTMLLNGLYEPEILTDTVRCMAHPLKKHRECHSIYTDYTADMNVLLTYYKCWDDWQDEKKLGRYLFARLLKNKVKRITKRFPQKAAAVSENLQQIRRCEIQKAESLDEAAGYFGRMIAQLFVYREDEWADSLRKIGFYLGKFIYLMDAYEDLEQDLKKGNYNPFAALYRQENFEEEGKRILTMMMAEVAAEFELLPILMNVEILRNILYAGVWVRYEAVCKKRCKKVEVKRSESEDNDD